MINKLLAITAGIVLLILSSCTEKVDLKLDSTYERLVVDGFITDKHGPQRVILTKTSDYFSNEPAVKVVNATVRISDGTDEWQMLETAEGISGIYESPTGLSGTPGKTYTLSIKLAEPISGETDFESTCVLNQVTTLDSVKAVLEPDWGERGFWLIKIYAQDPPGEHNYYMLNLYKNGYLWSDTITKVSISDDQFFNGTYLNGADAFLISNENDWQTLHPGDTVKVELSAITEEYYNFIFQVQQAGFNIPFFSGPPANVQGNVSNNGTGFFTAYSSSFASYVVR